MNVTSRPNGFGKQALTALSLALVAPPLSAQPPDLPEIDTDDPVPFVIPPTEGFATTTVADRSVFQILFRPTLELRSWREHPWGVRLRVAIQLTSEFHDIDDVPGNLQITSVVPGVEVAVPIGDRSLLRPFLDMGVGRITEERRGPLFGTGLGAEMVFPLAGFELGLEPLVSYHAAIGPRDGDATASGIGVYGDARHPLWFRIGEAQPDAGIYMKQTLLWSSIAFVASDGSPVTVNRFFEIGAIFGFQQRPKILFIKVPTIGVGYRFGQIRGLTIRIGGDRLLRLADPPRSTR
ncbi:MAG: hypothetical protein R3344_08845 [Acidobacteriota bacterium]|nr:hypothetical protein [Acidobacteriota bacterium]